MIFPIIGWNTALRDGRREGGDGISGERKSGRERERERERDRERERESEEYEKGGVTIAQL
jgi:hypothetical protein